MASMSAECVFERSLIAHGEPNEKPLARLNLDSCRLGRRVALSARGAQVPDDSESRMNAETLSEASGLLAVPGDYSAILAKEVGGEITTFGPPVRFEVVPLRGGALPGSSYAEAAAFWRSYENSVRTASAVNRTLGGEMNRVEAMKTALSNASTA